MKPLFTFFLFFGSFYSLFAQPNTPPITPDVFLCSVGFESVNYDLANVVVDMEGNSIAFFISQSPSTGTLDYFSEFGTFTYTPEFIGFEESFVYTVCDYLGACSNGTVYIALAEMEELPPIMPTVVNFTAQAGTTLNICEGNIGWAWANNCIPNLYTVCVTHNETMGQINYVDDNCVAYTPAQTGTDTIRIVGCGDAPPPIIYTCNGWEQMNTCSYTYYIVSIVPNNNSFTEVYNITCDSTLLIGQLGYPTWVTPSIIDPPANGNAAILTDGLWSSLQYIPNSGFSGSDTIVVECAHATQITCETGTYIVNVECTNSVITQTDAHNSPIVFYNVPEQKIVLTFTHTPTQSTQVSLFNSSGQLLETIAAGVSNYLQIDAKNLPAGMYLLTLQTQNLRNVVKVMVIK